MQKAIKWAVATALAVASPALYALGLGSAKVNSYLNQPLDVKVELISQSSEELQSITAGLASAKDFELLGLKLNSISVPLEFKIVSDGVKPYIHITSRLNIGDPVMQVLLEVVWANGRMLREYTLFLDPPTLTSKAPAPAVAPTQVVAAPAPVQATSPASSAPASAQAKTITPPKQLDSPPAAGEAADSNALALENESGSSSRLQQDEDSSIAVAKGQTLWGIASDWSKGTGNNVNQTMLAIQRKNPSAFIDNNINRLKQGEILRMPSSNEMADISSQQAALEVLRQGDEIKATLGMPDYSTPTVADSGGYQESALEDVIFADDEDQEGYLELVPPSDTTDNVVDAISQASDEVSADDVNEQILQEKLSRTEEDLVNAELENNYLKERVSTLETEAEAARSVQLQDADLANMENKLADKLANAEPEPAIALTPGGEEQAWYAGATIWILAAILFLILLIVWFLRTRSRQKSTPQQDIENQATAQAVADEAEDLLDILDNYGASGSTRSGKSHADDEAVEVDPDADLDDKSEADSASESETETKVMPVMVPGPVIEEKKAELEKPDLADSGGPATRETDESNELTGINAGIKIETEVGTASETVEDGSEEDDDGESSDPELKLDLARAYLSLGDKEAAKSMLDEVMSNGNDDQKAEARQMLDEL